MREKGVCLCLCIMSQSNVIVRQISLQSKDTINHLECAFDFFHFWCASQL
jgi:hypothetical protein